MGVRKNTHQKNCRLSSKQFHILPGEVFRIIQNYEKYWILVSRDESIMLFIFPIILSGKNYSQTYS